ncbi:MAG: carbon monoxide dehydrogenase [Chloroflexi bacterium]|nr:carbon monoxide dehydrogenase [Chloroflexota bacterium]
MSTSCCGGTTEVRSRRACCAPAEGVVRDGTARTGIAASGRALVWRTDSRLTAADRWDHVLARLGYRRGDHRVEPGLYALGQPTSRSPVLVTANYSLSFDALRSSLDGRSAWILVLDTKGINVWCAAGKGTFGTEELVRRIEDSGLDEVVDHRRLILPQLGAPGVAAHEVRRRSGFRVEYGPVRARDLPRYLDTGQATPEMRRVTFTLGERLVLVPVEIKHYFLPMVGLAVALYVLASVWGALGAIAAILAGAALLPALLPWLPTKDFSSKGLLLGTVVALGIGLGAYVQGGDLAPWVHILRSAGLLCLLPPITAYLALNFTGSTPITSQTAVAREIKHYIRPLVALAGSGTLMTLIAGIARWIGG